MPGTRAMSDSMVAKLFADLEALRHWLQAICDVTYSVVERFQDDLAT